MGPALGDWGGAEGSPAVSRRSWGLESQGHQGSEGDLREEVSPGQSSPQRPHLLFPQQAHIPNSIMAILEASGKQEPETKEAPAGPLEEVRVPRAPPTHTSHFCGEGLELGLGRRQPLTPCALSAVCLRVVSIFSPPSP